MTKEDKFKKDYEFARKCALENVKLMEIYKSRIDKALKRLEKISTNVYYYKYNNRYLKSEILEDVYNILKGEENE